MKSIRIITIAGGLTLAGLLAACGSVSSVTSPATLAPYATPATNAPVAVAMSPSDTFLAAINGEDANISSAAGGNATLLALAGGVCSDWNNGDDASQVITDGVTGVGEQTVTSITVYQIGEIIGVATTTMCPAYDSQLHAYLVANGDA